VKFVLLNCDTAGCLSCWDVNEGGGCRQAKIDDVYSDSSADDPLLPGVLLVPMVMCTAKS